MNCVAEEAFAAPADHGDLLDAYEALIAETKGGTLLEAHKARLCRVADEVYYSLRYQGLPVDSANDRLATLEIYDLAAFSASGVSGGSVPYSPQVFYDAAQLRAHRASAPAASMAPPPKRSCALRRVSRRPRAASVGAGSRRS